MAISKYLKVSAIDQLAEEGFKTRQAVNSVINQINTSGATTKIATDEVLELMGRPAAYIKAATQWAKPAGSTNMVDLETGNFAIDEDGVTHMFVADASLKGTADAPKQWHEVNHGLSQAQADARYLQIGIQEIEPTVKLSQNSSGPTIYAVQDPKIGTVTDGKEFSLDFEDKNISAKAGWVWDASPNNSSKFYIVEATRALDVDAAEFLPAADVSGATELPYLKNADGTPWLLPQLKAKYKENTFRFRRELKAGKTEATATWKDWEYIFVDLAPKLSPFKTQIKKYSTYAELFADKEKITYILLTPIADISVSGTTWRKGATTVLGSMMASDSGDLRGQVVFANGLPYDAIAGSAGVWIYAGGVEANGGAIVGYDKFYMWGMTASGNALTSAGGSATIMGTLGEIYDIENGRGVAHSADKVLNIQEIAELFKDQKDIDKNFMATFRDRITYTKTKELTYDDLTRKQSAPGGAYNWVKSGLASYTAPVTVSSTSLTYDNLINPYNRIIQEQASFIGEFKVNSMSVEYKFFATNKALKFSGNNGQTYKWETFGKFENNARIPYIRFSGSGAMEIATNDALNPTYTNQSLPYEMKLSDLMPNTDAGRTAIVKMNFGTLPAIGTEIMEIDYVTSTLFVENRFKNFLGGIEQEIFENKAIKFKEKLDEVRNHAITIQPASPYAPTVNPMPYKLKKGMTNSWATNDERFIIQVFDTENKEIYTTFYDDANANANTYSGQPAIQIRLADGSMKTFYLAVWTSDDAEGATIDFLEADQVTKANLPFHYEAYITMDIPTPARHDLTNSVIAQAEVGKLFRVKADRTIEYVETHDVAVTYDDNSTGTWKVIKS